MTKTKWVFDPAHSEIGFTVKHMMVMTLHGKFKEFDASIYTTGDDFMTAEIDCYINAASVDTGSADRDKHLKSVDFFDVENHKEITFSGNTYEKVDNDGSYEMYGDLTIRGIAKRIKLSVEFGGILKDPWGNEKAIFSINGKIKRSDSALNWNAPLADGGLLVSDEIRIECNVQLMKSNEVK